MRNLELGKQKLSLENVREVASLGRKVDLAVTARERIVESRKSLERLVSGADRPLYGINTGFGSLKNVQIPSKQLAELQVNLIRSHAVGVGTPLPKEAVRAMMLLRANTLSLGHSGVRPEVVEQLLAMLNADVVPVVPGQGSVGASGDLAPLAHLALGMLGEGKAEYRGQVIAAKKALKSTGISPLKPAAKEALALLNGTQMMTAVGILSLLAAENALIHADVAAAMTLEATLGSARAFDERVHKLRPHWGQVTVAGRMRKLLAASEIAKSHENCGRVQDAYSIRCVPQVHGAAWDALAYVRKVLECEVSSVTDNPIVVDDDIISAGNFHGQPVALALDLLPLALTPVASISERRTFRLLDAHLSELPVALVKDAGLQSGLMMAQVTSAALVNECKTLSFPASVDSIPTWAEQEDHVSMGATAARKAAHVVDLLTQVVAIELFCAAQGLEFRKPLRPAKKVEAAWKAIRKEIPVVKEDRPLYTDFETAKELVEQGTLLDAIGPLK